MPTLAVTGRNALSASSTVSGSGFTTYLASPPAIGGTTPAAGAFTTLTAKGNVNLNLSGTAATNIGTGSTTSAVTIGNSSNTTNLESTSLTLNTVTTGTAADTLCLSSGRVVLIQAAACTISSLRFKTDLSLYDKSVLDIVPRLDVENFRMKAGPAANPDPNYGALQVGLIAENIARVVPECALYENDMKTPKSYRQECLIALLVKGEQELMAQNLALRARIAKFEQTERGRPPGGVPH